MTHIAFIGLGHMGLPMCKNLLKAGHSISAFDLNAEACAQAKEAGARIAASAIDTLSIQKC